MNPGDLVADRYRLLEPVGSGAMGVVWRALDTELDRVVALKRAHNAIAADADDARIRREARMAAGVHHPGVVTLFDAVRDGGSRWLVMEYVPADNLADVLRERGPLPIAETVRIGVALAEALAAVHAAGVVHRDVKPGNVLIARDGTVKLTDFGISRGTWSEQTLTASALVIGTPAYIAPEVARGDPPTSAADVFALGAVLFAAVEGAPPYGSADNPLALLRRAAAGQLAPFTRAGALEPALAALLDPDPARRPTADRARELLAVRRPSAPPEIAPVPSAPGGRTLGGKGTAALVAAALVLVGGGGAVLAAHGDDGGEATAQTVGSASLVGNQRTADPCSVLDPAELGGFGAARVHTALGAYNRCDAVVQAPSGEQATVRVLIEGGGEDGAGGTKLTVGQFSVLQAPAQTTTCDRTVLLPATERVRVTTAHLAGPAGLDLCGIDDAAVAGATAVLARGPLPRRSLGFPAESLGRARACDLLEPRSLARVEGLAGAEAEPGFGEWACSWSTGQVSVDVRFARATPAEAAVGTRRTVAGRDTYTRAGAQGTCLVRIVNLRTEIDKAPTVELVDLLLRGEGSAAYLCADARALAADVAPLLPGRPAAMAASTVGTPPPAGTLPDQSPKASKASNTGAKADRRTDKKTGARTDAKTGPKAAPTPDANAKANEQAQRCAATALNDPLRTATCTTP